MSEARAIYNEYRATTAGEVLKTVRTIGEGAMVLGTAEAIAGKPWGAAIAAAGLALTVAATRKDMQLADAYVPGNPRQARHRHNAL